MNGNGRGKAMRNTLTGLALVSMLVLLAACGDPGGVQSQGMQNGGSGGGSAPSDALMVSLYASDTENTLRWEPVPGVTGYRVYSGDSPYVDLNGAPIEVQSNSFVDGGLEPEQHRYYVVTAQRDGQDEHPSREVGGRARLPAPFTPTGVTATPDEGQVTLDWHTFAGAHGYRIYWNTIPGVTPATGTRNDVQGPPFIHQGLVNGTTYYYVVTAVNPGGESAASQEVSAKPDREGVVCYRDLPKPEIVFERAEPFSDTMSRFHLDVPNRAAFPDELFLSAPHLPACGLNTDSSRTWVEIFDGFGNRIYGFCGLGSAQSLNAIWFAAETLAPPSHVYIVLKDRECGIEYVSDPVTIGQESGWKSMAPMPTPTNRTTSTTLGDRIYVIGGYLASSKTAAVWIYEPVTGAWSGRAPLPTARCCLGSATVGGTVYAIGGSGSGGALNRLDAYDPATNSWSLRASMPTARSFPMVGVLDGRIYVIGGRIGTPWTNANEVYDPATNRWYVLAPVPTSETVQDGTVIGGAIYVVTYESMETWRYDPATNTWSQRSQGPYLNRSGASATALNGRMHVLGGYSGAYLNHLDIYDPATDTWTPGLPMPTPRYTHTASALNGKIYAMGGWAGGMVSAVEVYTP